MFISVFRLDQTLGKPGSWFVGNDRDKQKLTIAARLARVENQVGLLVYVTVDRWRSGESTAMGSLCQIMEAFLVVISFSLYFPLVICYLFFGIHFPNLQPIFTL